MAQPPPEQINFSAAARFKGMIVGIIVLIATILCSAVLHFRAMDALKHQVRNNLIRAAQNVAREVDGDLHRTFTSKDQETTPEYEKALIPLRRALYFVEHGKMRRNDYRFIYTCVMSNSQVYFVLDPTPPGDADKDGVEDKSHIMQPYDEASEQLKNTLTSGEPYGDEEPYKDAWGTFVSGYAPFYDSHGKLAGAVGVDWYADTYAERLAGIRRAWYLQIALCLISGFVSGLGAGMALVKRERAEAERRHAIEEARRNRERWRIMVETLPKPAVHLEDGVFWINAQTEHALGYKRDEIKSLDHWFEVLFGDKAKEIRALYDADRAAGFPKSREVVVKHKDGRERWVEFTAHIYEPGEVWLLEDITERKEYQAHIIRAREEAEAAAAAKSSFLATVSHEIRTPMNGVIGMTNLLLESPLEVRQREMTETIRNCGEALIVVINDILDFSKIESGGMELEKEPFDLRACVEDCLDLFAPKAAEKSIDLVYSMPKECPGTVRGDSTRFRQVLCNLIGNAVKFTHAGVVEVRLEIEGGGNPATGDDFTLRVNVRDTGIGIPADRMDRLFKSFSQVDSSTARKYGGTGLGLAISKKLSELMGGAMGVTSEVGKGSVFFFTLRTKAEKPLNPLGAIQANPSLEGVKVLLVVDNQTTREILQGYLHQWGMQCLAVDEAQQAIRLWNDRGPYNLLITDLQLPGMDGMQLCRKLRETSAKPPKIIMITSTTREDIKNEAKAVGVSQVLQKPLRPSTLLMAIEEILALSTRLVTAAQAAPAASPTSVLANEHPLKILVTDDNKVNQLVARRMFERFGYQVDMAGNGVEAVAAAQKQTYDVIFMDVQMPEMNGFEATQRIRELLPKEKQPLIVALTANAMEGDRDTCLQNGMNDYLSKPLRFPDLEKVLKGVKRISVS
ncbi:MAG TPA: response regulator [Verrucomicrobiae bacterium]